MNSLGVIVAIFLLFGTLIGLRQTPVLAQDDGGWDTRGPDGHYHNPNTGEVMADSCNRHADNKHPCNCHKSDPEANCDPAKHDVDPGTQCQTYCRKNDCHCVPDCPS